MMDNKNGYGKFEQMIDTITGTNAVRTKEIIRMYFIDDTTQTDIAKTMGVSSSAIRAAIAKGMRAMRNNLSSDGETLRKHVAFI